MVTDIYFDDLITDSDEVFELDGAKVIVDQFSFQYLDGTVIDYVEGDFESGFKFKSPALQTSCGCGKSQSF
jgi:iron-sulfur cluster assembly protein